MAITDPRDIPGLVLWLSAEHEAANYADAAAMSSWTDLSGNGHDFPAGATAPTFLAAGGEAGPAVQMYPGWFEAATNPLTGATAGEVFFRVKSDAGTSDAGLHGLAQQGTSGQRYYPTSTGWREAFGWYTTITDVGTWVDDGWATYSMLGGTTSSKVEYRRDSTVLYTNNLPDGGRDNWLEPTVIGAGLRGFSLENRAPLRGQVSCVVVYDRELTTTERADLNAWLVANPSGGDLPPTGPTPTRFYLANDPAAAPAPVSPSYDSLWTENNGIRCLLPTAKVQAPGAARYVDKTVAASVHDGASLQLVSDPLPAKQIDGTARLTVEATETTSSRNAFLQAVIRVVSGDGTTVRGTLYAGQTATVASATATDPNYEFALFSTTTRVLDMTLTPVVAQAGDRLVVEIGARAVNGNTYNNSVTISFGSESVDADLEPTVDRDAGAGEIGWIEFSQDVFAEPATPTWNDAVADLTPYLWWKLDEASGSTAADASGNGRDGTVAGTYTRGQPSLIPSDASGLSTDVSDSAGAIGTGSGYTFSSTAMTAALTFQSSTDQTGRWFRGNLSHYLLIGTSAITVYIYDADGIGKAYALSYDPTVLFDGQPHLVLWRVDSSTTDLWVDGVQVASTAHTVASNTLTQFYGKVGFQGLTGRYDDILLVDRAISTAEVEGLYAAWAGDGGGTPTPTALAVDLLAESGLSVTLPEPRLLHRPYVVVDTGDDAALWGKDGGASSEVYVEDGAITATMPVAGGLLWRRWGLTSGAIDLSASAYLSVVWWTDSPSAVMNVENSGGQEFYADAIQNLGGGWKRSWFSMPEGSITAPGFYVRSQSLSAGSTFKVTEVGKGGLRIGLQATASLDVTLPDPAAQPTPLGVELVASSDLTVEMPTPVRSLSVEMSAESTLTVTMPQGVTPLSVELQATSRLSVLLPGMVAGMPVTLAATSTLEVTLPNPIVRLSVDLLATSTLSIDTTPEGDLFANPLFISDLEGELTINMSRYSTEAGEAVPVGTDSTLWLRYLVPDGADGLPRFFSAENAELNVYDLEGSLLQQSSGFDLVLDALPGGEVMLQVAVDSALVPSLTVSWLDSTPNPHVDQEDALEIDGDYGTEDLSLENGGEAGSAWLTWVAEETTTLTMTLFPYPETAVVTATAVDSGGQIAQSSGSAEFSLEIPVFQGTTYWLQITSDTDLVDLELEWQIEASEVVPAEPYTYLRAEVYRPDGVTLLSEVPRRSGVNFQEPLNEAGGGEMSIRADDPLLDAYPDLFHWGNIIKFWLGNTCVHGFRIRQRKTALVTTNEWQGFVKTVSGPSVHHLLDDFIVQHDKELLDRSLDVREFSWVSPVGEWYDAKDWHQKYDAWTQDNPPSLFERAPKDRPKYGMPANWPDKDSLWLWIQQNGHTAYPNHPNLRGRRYYRKSFWMGEPKTVRIYASADEEFVLYLDGEEVLSGSGEETGYTSAEKRKLKLRRGWHVLAASTRMRGTATKADGADAFMCTVQELDDKGKPAGAVVRTNKTWDTTWKRPAPSWNRAQVLRAVVREARKRGNGSANALQFGFTATHDSRGRKWLDRWADEASIGTTALALQAALSEGNRFDVWVDPADLTLQAWRRRGRNKSHSITLETGRNLMQYEVDEVDDVKNVFLLQYETGWTRWKSRKSVRRYGEREAYLSLGHANDDQDAKKVVRKASEGISHAQARAGTSDIVTRRETGPSGGLIAVPGARPFLDFNVGDVVKAPNSNGLLRPHRILALSCTEDSEGNLTYDPELEEVR